MSARCRSCNADVEWVVTAKGRRMPLDVDTSKPGTLVVRSGVAYDIRHEGTDREPDEVLRVSHFATCPNASKHRKQPA